MEDKDTSTGADFQEIRQILKETSQLQLENVRMLQELGRQVGDLGERLGARRSFDKTERLLQESGEINKQNVRLIRELGNQIGGLGEKFGGFTEGLALPSMTKILKERFHATFVSPKTRAWKDGEEMEVDVLAYANSGTDEVYVVEVKSHLRQEGIRQMLKTLQKFRDFFPQHKDKKLYGILAAVDAPQELQKKVLQEGIYMARIHDGVFEVQVPEDFQPREF